MYLIVLFGTTYDIRNLIYCHPYHTLHFQKKKKSLLNLGKATTGFINSPFESQDLTYIRNA